MVVIRFIKNFVRILINFFLFFPKPTVAFCHAKKKNKKQKDESRIIFAKSLFDWGFFWYGKGKISQKPKKKNFSAQKRKKRKKRHRAVLVSKFRNLGVDKSQPLLLRVQASLDHSSTRTRTTTVTTTLYPKKKKLNEINKHKSRD